MYPEVRLFINGKWRPGAGKALPVFNPATGDEIGRVAHATVADLEDSVHAAERGFLNWKNTSAYERSRILRKAADLMRSRVDETARLITLEQGKPLSESKAESLASADIIDWFAEESRRTYGWTIPPRQQDITQLAVREPVGPVAAFTPWNFPLNQAVRKVSAALATGCSIILKGPEETPASCAELVRAFDEAGVPEGVINLVFGTPAEISKYLISHPIIRKVTFTGSTPVGKQLAMLAGQHMKRITMELGGHAPVVIFEDADIDEAAKILSAMKFRNAGQVCVAPTRFLVQERVYEDFIDALAAEAAKVNVGDGLASDTTMGPVANPRRLSAMHQFVGDAKAFGAEVVLGGKQIGERGNFYEPTLLANVPSSAQIMHEEPFGPVAAITRFSQFDEAVREANRLPYGLAAYAFTKSLKTANAISAAVESGMVSINHYGLGLPELPFGGVKESGFGSEGGRDATESYLNTKFISLRGV